MKRLVLALLWVAAIDFFAILGVYHLTESILIEMIVGLPLALINGAAFGALVARSYR